MQLRLKELREKKGLSKRQLSRLSGVTWMTIHHIERGDCKDPRLSTVLALASVLGTTVEGLLSEHTGQASPHITDRKE